VGQGARTALGRSPPRHSPFTGSLCSAWLASRTMECCISTSCGRSLGHGVTIQIFAHVHCGMSERMKCPGGPDRNSRSYKRGQDTRSSAQSPSGMPRQARLHFLSLKSSLVNLPVSLFGPLLERNIASPSFSSHPLHTNHIVFHSISVHNMLLSCSRLSYHLSGWMERKLMHMLGGQAWFLLHP